MYDLIIIGGGPGGYVSAERAGKAGLKTLLFEKENLGGVCLNRGCIPTKTLLHCAKTYKHSLEGKNIGVEVDKAVFNLEAAMKHKEKVISQLRKGIAFLMKSNKIEVINQSARLKKSGVVISEGKEYQAKNIILAQGSSPMIPPIPGIKEAMEKGIVQDSKGILNINKLPSSLAVIGGGVIGMEFANFFSMLGVKVEVIEMLPEILPSFDPKLASALRKSQRKINFHLSSMVTSIDGNTINIKKDDKSSQLQADMILISTGRKANIDQLDKESGLDFDKKGIKIDDQCRSNLPGVFAIGDITGRAQLAHAASRMGEVAVNTILGQKDIMRWERIPGVVYTSPEVALCGLSEKQAEEKGISYQTKEMPLGSNGRFLAENPGERGTCKMIINQQTGAVIGMEMFGNGVSELISLAALMIENEMRPQDIQQTVFPHPVVAEVAREISFHF